MAKRVLLKSQANAVFEIVRKAGLDPSEFRWREKSTFLGITIFSSLVHTPTGYYFDFSYSGIGRRAKFTPNPNLQDNSEVSYDVVGWEELLIAFTRWVEIMQGEVLPPNLWDTLSRDRKLVEVVSASTETNTPFTEAEQEYISEQLKEIRDYLFKTANLSESHRQFVTARLNYLAEAAKRQSRLDWKNLLVGVLFSVATETALTSGLAREFFRFAWSALGQLFVGTPALPQ